MELCRITSRCHSQSPTSSDKIDVTNTSRLCQKTSRGRLRNYFSRVGHVRHIHRALPARGDGKLAQLIRRGFCGHSLSRIVMYGKALQKVLARTSRRHRKSRKGPRADDRGSCEKTPDFPSRGALVHRKQLVRGGLRLAQGTEPNRGGTLVLEVPNSPEPTP